MIKEDSQEVTRIDLEEIAERSEEEQSEVQSELQSQIGSQDGACSNQGATQTLQQDRDPKGVNQCLKVNSCYVSMVYTRLKCQFSSHVTSHCPAFEGKCFGNIHFIRYLLDLFFLLLL